MDHRLGALHAARDRRGVGEVALDQLAAQIAQRCGLLGRAHKRDDVITSRSQLAHYVAADEPCSPRYEDLHRRS